MMDPDPVIQNRVTTGSENKDQLNQIHNFFSYSNKV